MQDQDKLIFQIFLPSPLLRPYIQDYWYIENTQDVALTIPVLPDGCDNIIWNFYDTQNPVIEGVIEYVRNVEIPPKMKLFGVKFGPGQLSQILDCDMQKIRKNTPKLRDINTLLAQHIFLYNCNDVNQIVAEINQSLISLYTDHQTTSDGQKIQHMIDILEMCSYKIQITELAQQLHMSEKTLGRLVYRHMGVPPKTLLRIFKFQNAHKHLVQHGFTSMISAAFSGGYFDQPHFNREYKKFTGTFPTDETLSILYNTSQAEHI